MISINKENQEKYKDQSRRSCSLFAGLNHLSKSSKKHLFFNTQFGTEKVLLILNEKIIF